jgi:predicted phage gp36 major capsid-like protein
MMDIELNQHGLETKAGVPAGGAVTHDELMRVVGEFQQANDARLAAIERKQGDVLNDEKVARLNSAIDTHQRRLDELTLKAARPALGVSHAGGAPRPRWSTKRRSTPMCGAASRRACGRSR